MEQGQNPYGFHLSEEQATASSPEPQNAYYQSASNGNYSVNQQDYQAYGGSTPQGYQAYANMDPNYMVTDVTGRKKQCLVISLGVMSAGLVVSTISALIFMILFSRFMDGRIFLGLFFGSFILEFAMIWLTNRCIAKRELGLGIAAYITFAIANGTTFMSIFSMYSPISILGLFFLTAVIFGGTALVALIIPKDITGWTGSLIMGLFALIALGLIYLFIPVRILDLFICSFGIVLFIAITAYDFQKIRKLAMEDVHTSVWIVGLFGGMNLYLDFVNLLLKILRLFGRRK